MVEMEEVATDLLAGLFAGEAVKVVVSDSLPENGAANGKANDASDFGAELEPFFDFGFAATTAQHYNADMTPAANLGLLGD